MAWKASSQVLSMTVYNGCHDFSMAAMILAVAWHKFLVGKKDLVRV